MNLYAKYKVTNSKLSSLSLPWINPVERYSRLRYTREGLASETIARFKYDSAGIGNRFPRENYVVKQTFCPLCPTWVRNTVSHVAMFCASVEKFRSVMPRLSLMITCLSSLLTDFPGIMSQSLIVLTYPEEQI